MSRPRKILLILALTAVVLTIAAGIVLTWYVGTDHFRQRLNHLVVGVVEDRFPVNVRMGDLRVRPLRGVLEIEDLAISARTRPDQPPEIQVGAVSLNFTLTAFGSPRVSLDRLEVEGLRLHLRVDDNDRLNLLNMFAPQPGTGGPGFSPVRLGISEIGLRDAVVTYADQAVEFDSGSDGFELDLELDPERRAYVGSVGMERLSVDVNDFPLPVTSFRTRFRLEDNRLDFLDAELGSDQVSGTLQGSVTDLRQFEYRFETRLEVDPSRFTEPNLADHFEPSVVGLEGEVLGRRGDFTWKGRIASPRLIVEGIALLDVEGGVVVDRRGADFDALRCRIFGGNADASGRLAFRQDEISSVQVEASGTQLASVLSNWGVRFPRVQATQRVSMQVQWPGLEFRELAGTGNLSLWGQLVDDDRAQLVPVQASTRVRIIRRYVELEAGEIQTPAGLGRFSGGVGFDGAYQIAAEVAWVDTFEAEAVLMGWDLLTPEVGTEWAPRLEGWMNASAEVQGGPGNPLEVSGQVSIAGLSLRGESLGSVSGAYTYRSDRLEVPVMWVRGPQHLLRLSLGMDTEPAALDRLDLDLSGMPAELLLRVAAVEAAGIEGGIAEGGFRWSGEQDAGQGRITVRDLRWAGLAFPRVETEFRVDQEGLVALPMQASLMGGKLSGALQYAFDDGSMRLQFDGAGIDLASLPWQSEFLPLRGALGFEGEVNILNGEIAARIDTSVPELALGDYVAREVRLRGNPGAEAVKIELEFEFLGNDFRAGGEVGLKEGYPFRLELPLEVSSLAPILAELRPELELADADGRLAGRLTVQGTFTDLDALEATLDLDQVRFGNPDFTIALGRPARLSWSGKVVEVPALQLVGTQTRVELGGKLDLKEEAQVNLSVAGDVNLELLTVFAPELRSSGQVLLETRITGPLADPRIVGTARLAGASLSGPELPVEITGGQGSFRFTASQISVDDLRVDTDFGPLNLSGGIFLDGLTPSRWQINALGYGLAIPYPADFNTVVDVDLDLIRNDDTYLLAGAIYLRAAEFTRNMTVAELIYSFASAQADLPSDPGLADQVNLDLSLDAYQSLRVSNNLAQIVGSGELSLIGTLAEPVLLGNISIDEGRLRLEGNQYEITRGTVSFNNPRKTTPFLNFEAETQVREFDVTLSVRGPVDQFQMSFRSEPPLSTPSIVSLLAAGQTQEEIFGSERINQTDSSTLMAYGAGTLLSKTLGEVVENQTSRLFGFERFSIDPFVDDTRGRDPGARITLGKQLTRELGITYISSLGNSFQDQTVIIQYQVTDWLTAVGTSSPGDGTVAIDFKFKKRF